ncbi:hypothetical protein SV7mr_53220 [Stieleria bergensis]|uniref:Uncharacterized protein n=1 Tax=Stieleria bergensis TaxID=2528025 RepID=A0A517T364_9BACT|nr:hypothetical protein SV7mr_53220 [Planctomycetes bacterium SV_7m_r]
MIEPSQLDPNGVFTSLSHRNTEYFPSCLRAARTCRNLEPKIVRRSPLESNLKTHL